MGIVSSAHVHVLVSRQTHAQTTPHCARITGICGACRGVLESKLGTPLAVNTENVNCSDPCAEEPGPVTGASGDAGAAPIEPSKPRPRAAPPAQSPASSAMNFSLGSKAACEATHTTQLAAGADTLVGGSTHLGKLFAAVHGLVQLHAPLH